MPRSGPGESHSAWRPAQLCDDTGGCGGAGTASNAPLYPPRDVSSADLVIKNQQGIKAEVEARADRFSACIDMGQELLARSHYAAEEVGETRRESG